MLWSSMHPNSRHLCARVEQLTSTTLDNLFEVQLSEQGTTRRQEETRVLAFWRDLLDTEDRKTALSLADILMFATGLSSLPPPGINPRPKLVFQRKSRFPCSRTCANTMEIPLSMTYEEFAKDMDFGIENSPGSTVITCIFSSVTNQPCSSMSYKVAHRSPRSLAALHHFAYGDPQGVTGDGNLHMDCALPHSQMAAVRPVKLETHSQFHQTWE